MLVTVNDYEGQIFFHDNTFDQNMLFIPSAIASNNIKYNATSFYLQMSKFYSDMHVREDGFKHKEGAHLQFSKMVDEKEYHFLNYLDLERDG